MYKNAHLFFSESLTLSHIEQSFSVLHVLTRPMEYIFLMSTVTFTDEWSGCWDFHITRGIFTILKNQQIKDCFFFFPFLYNKSKSLLFLRKKSPQKSTIEPQFVLNQILPAAKKVVLLCYNQDVKPNNPLILALTMSQLSPRLSTQKITVEEQSSKAGSETHSEGDLAFREWMVSSVL